MRRASVLILPLLIVFAACGDDVRPEGAADSADAGAEYDPMRMESDPADSIAAAAKEQARAQAFSDSVRREVMRKAGLPDEPPPPPEVLARPPIRGKADCLAQADSVGGDEGQVLRSACRSLPDAY